MKRKHNCKRIMAWLLTAATVFGNSSFAALAEEATSDEAAAIQIEAAAPAEEAEAVEAAEPESAEPAEETAEELEEAAPVQDTALTEDMDAAESTENASEELGAAAEAGESAEELTGDEMIVPEEGTEADIPVENMVSEAEGILLENMKVMPEGFELMPAEEGEEEEPRYDLLALSWKEYGNEGDQRDEKGNLLNPECVYYGTWVFPGSTVTLNVEGLENLEEELGAGPYTLQVRSFTVDPETGETFDTEDYVTAVLSEDQQSITVTGRQVTNDQPSIVEIQALDESGNPVAAAGMDVSVIESVEDYWLELDPYQNAVFPNDWYWLNRVHYQIQTPEHPYWTDDTTEIEDVDITRQYTWDEEGNEIETDGIVADSTANEYGDWYLQMGESCGCVEYTAHFTLPIGENGKEGKRMGKKYLFARYMWAAMSGA